VTKLILEASELISALLGKKKEKIRKRRRRKRRRKKESYASA